MLKTKEAIFSQRRLRRGLLLVVVLIAAFTAVSCITGEMPAPDEAPPEEPLAPVASPELALATATPAAVATQAQVTPAGAATPLPAIPEQRTLALEWPAKIRVGDAELIRLILEVDLEGKITATAQTPGNEVVSEIVEIPNLYDTHNVLIESRLDLVGMEYTPHGDVIEALLPGKTVVFLWSVRAGEVGGYKGAIWLHLRFVPKEGGPEERIVLSGQVIEIQAVNLLGMGGKAARVLGSVGAVIGSALSLDNLLPALWKLIKRRRKTKPVERAG